MGPAIRAEPWRNDQNAPAFSQLRQWSLGRWLVAPLGSRVPLRFILFGQKGVLSAGSFARLAQPECQDSLFLAEKSDRICDA